MWYKAPNDLLDYQQNWTAWMPTGDAINTVTWTADSGITVETSPAATNTATTATVWLGGGTLGTSYKITGQITTTAGRIAQRVTTINIVTI